MNSYFLNYFFAVPLIAYLKEKNEYLIQYLPYVYKLYM